MKTNMKRLNVVFLVLVLIGFSKCDFKRRTLLIKEYKTVERVSIGMDVNKATKRLDRRFYVDQRETPMFELEKLKEYVVYKDESKKEVLFSFNGGYESKNEDNVFRIVVMNPGYNTKDGVSVGMTIKELKQKTKIRSADFNYTDGLFLISDVFDGGFLIDTSDMDFSSFNFENIDLNNIPEDLKVKQIIIF